MAEDEIDYYEILQIQKTSTQSEIKKSYLKLSLKYHPDKATEENKIESEKKMKEINEAYSVLSDPEKRSIYDKIGKKGLDNNYDHDPFSNFFKQEKQHIPPIEIKIIMELKDRFLGKKINVKYKRNTLCVKCNASGTENGESDICNQCGGHGFSVKHLRNGPFIQQMKFVCDSCNGTGLKAGAKKCVECNGMKFFKETYELTYFVPKGNHGTIKIDNIGHEIPKHIRTNLTRGAVLLIFEEIDHPIFKRVNGTPDLLITLKLSLADVVCGFVKTIEHVDGRKLALIQENNINLDEIKIIQNEGLPLNGSSHSCGNLVVKFELELPQNLTYENKKIIYNCLTGKSLDNLHFTLPEGHVMVTTNSSTESDYENHSNKQSEPNIQCAQQ